MEKKNRKPLVSVSLLVSNRINTISKCLESIKPLLEEIPSELIVVDTVGEEKSDGSLAVAKKYADKIVHFEWCNDFAAARNAGLFQASGEWFLTLDDDEWFEDVSEIIDFFKTGEYEKYESATYRLRNYTTLDGTVYAEVQILRMVKLQENTKYIGRIHEVFSETFLPCKAFNTMAHHYGYAYATEEEKMCHAKRNLSLLQNELEKDPGDMRYRTQMALELANFDNEGALKFCEETFERYSTEAKHHGFQWQLALVFRLYEALSMPVCVARERYESDKMKYKYSEAAELAICYQLVRIHLLKGENTGAYPYAKRYFELLNYLHEYPEQQQLQSIADFSRYQTEKSCLEILHFGAYSAICAGEYEQAWQWYEKMPWEEGSFDNEEAFQMLLLLFTQSPEVSRLIQILRRIMKNSTLIGKASIRSKISELLQQIK